MSANLCELVLEKYDFNAATRLKRRMKVTRFPDSSVERKAEAVSDDGVAAPCAKFSPVSQSFSAAGEKGLLEQFDSTHI